MTLCVTPWGWGGSASGATANVGTGGPPGGPGVRLPVCVCWTDRETPPQPAWVQIWMVQDPLGTFHLSVPVCVLATKTTLLTSAS